MAAENVNPAISQHHARIAINVVIEPCGETDLLKRRAIQGEIFLIQQGSVELAVALKGVRVAQIEKQGTFHGAIGLDARRYAHAEALAEQKSAIGESLERVRPWVGAIPERRIEHVPQSIIEVVDAVGEGPCGDSGIDSGRISDVVSGVL